MRPTTPLAVLLLLPPLLAAQAPAAGSTGAPGQQPKPAAKTPAPVGKKDPAATKKGDKAPAVKPDPKVQAITQAVARMTAKAGPIHFRYTVLEDRPEEDIPTRAEGELWSHGAKRLRLSLRLELGGIKQVHDIYVNDQGAWLRMPGEPVLRVNAKLLADLARLEAKGLAKSPASQVTRKLDILGALRAEGYRLRWQGEKKLGKTPVDLVEAVRTRKVPAGGESADRVVVAIAKADRLPRKVEFYVGKRRVRVQEYSAFSLNKPFPKSTFQFKKRPGEREVDILDTYMGQAIRNALKKL